MKIHLSFTGKRTSGQLSLTGGVASKLFTFNIVYKCSLLLCISGVAGDLLQSHVMNITDINTV
jgi:hypothetical protein